MNWLEELYAYFGGGKYTAGSICMTSDYVLVNTFTALRLVVAASSLLIAGILTICYLNGNYLTRMAVLLLKDKWIVKTLALTMVLTGVNQIVAALIIHYALYYLQAAMLLVMAGTFAYVAFALSRVALDQSRQKSILSAFLDEHSEIADYDLAGPDSNGQIKILDSPLPIKHKNSPSAPKEDE